MPKVENDPTKRIAKPFVIIAGPRTGGTFLAHALSNHPDVFCDRGESLHQLSVWHRQNANNRISDVDLLFMLTHQEGYAASGFRMLFPQAFRSDIWAEIERTQPKVIFLNRRNLLRQAASLLHNRMVRTCQVSYYPLHSFIPVDVPGAIRVKPDVIVKTCTDLQYAYTSARDKLRASSLDILDIWYSDLVGYDGNQAAAVEVDAATHICAHIGVPVWYLTSNLTCIHQYPLKELFRNWGSIKIAVENSPFAHYLKHEEKWYKVGKHWYIGDNYV